MPRRRMGGLARGLAVLGLMLPFATVPALLTVGALAEPGRPPAAGFDWSIGSPRWSNFSLVAVYAGGWPAAMARSFAVVAVAVPLTVVVASWAALVITIAAPRTRRFLLAFTVVALAVPPAALWIPRFVLFERVGLIDTLPVLMVPALMATTPFYVLLLAATYWRLPRSVLDAAMVDGASPFTLWWRVVLPLSRPATATVAVLAFAAHWSNFVDALLYLTSPGAATLPLAISHLSALDTAMYPVAMAGAVVLSLPGLLVFLAAHRVVFAADTDRR